MSELMTAAQKAYGRYVNQITLNIDNGAALAIKALGDDYASNLEEIKVYGTAPYQRTYSIKGTSFYLVYEDGYFILNDQELYEFSSGVMIKGLLDLGQAFEEYSDYRKKMEEKWRIFKNQWKRGYERC